MTGDHNRHSSKSCAKEQVNKGLCGMQQAPIFVYASVKFDSVKCIFW